MGISLNYTEADMLISSFICAIMDKNQGIMFQTLKFFPRSSD
jgi:hypothetical protein